MSCRLFQILFLIGFFITNTFEWNETDKLWCYSCKGNECGQIKNVDDNKIICNKKTQLCWAGFIDNKPYRTCASRYCTPSEFSLDSNIQIETCCRTNFCNSISLSLSTTVDDDFIAEINDKKPVVLTDKDSDYNQEEDISNYDTDTSNRLVSISHIILFLIPLLLVLLF